MWSQNLSVLNPYESLLESNRKKQKERKRNRFIFWRNRKDVSAV